MSSANETNALHTVTDHRLSNMLTFKTCGMKLDEEVLLPRRLHLQLEQHTVSKIPFTHISKLRTAKSSVSNRLLPDKDLRTNDQFIIHFILIRNYSHSYAYSH